MKAPIALIAFNRPAYLEQTVRSLKAQAGGTLDGREIHLFQDGAVNAYSRLRYADDSDIESSIEIFRSHFPGGEVHFHGQNIGICETYCCAEKYLFEERGFDVAYFFEDDMVVSPVYLQMMEILEQFAQSSPSVAYFAAYGDYRAQPEDVERRRRQIINMGNHWAFGLKRTAWTEIHEFLSPYYQIVCGSDYAMRDHRAIMELFARSGVAPRGSSQDGAKAWACDRLGLWRCRTVLPFARYVGSKGAHMTPAVYGSIGFGRAVMANQIVDDLIFPDQDGIDAGLAEQRALYQAIMRDDFAALMRSIPARKLNPMRPCTADDIRRAYQLILHRDPESEDIIDRHAGKTAVFSLMQGLMQSKELHELAGRLDHP